MDATLAPYVARRPLPRGPGCACAPHLALLTPSERHGIPQHIDGAWLALVLVLSRLSRLAPETPLFVLDRGLRRLYRKPGRSPREAGMWSVGAIRPLPGWTDPEGLAPDISFHGFTTCGAAELYVLPLVPTPADVTRLAKEETGGTLVKSLRKEVREYGLTLCAARTAGALLRDPLF